MVAETVKTRLAWNKIREEARRTDLPTVRRLLGSMWKRAQAPARRTMREFAEECFTLPAGPYAGYKFSCDRQPFTRLWFDAVDSGQFDRFVLTGPSQSSKTTIGFIIPALYYHCELEEEHVICGVPDKDMAKDKWGLVLLPAFLGDPKFRKLLPTKGAGSKGGFGDLITFTNGTALKWMSGGGGDKERAHFDARVVLITETDGFDTASDTSKETDPLGQLQARTRSYGDRARAFLECTLSTEDGRTWRELKQGTDSRVLVPCPHCGSWVLPEREQLKGWENAADEIEAAEKSRFHCPDCDAPFTDDQRIIANRDCRLLHRGQSIDADGEIHGDPPRTKTLGFRYTAFHNLFNSQGLLGTDLWKSEREKERGNDEQADAAEKYICQFVFAMPFKSSGIVTAQLDEQKLYDQMAPLPRGIVPADATCVVCHIDVHKRYLVWMVMAFGAGACGYIVDYATTEVETDTMGFDLAFQDAAGKLIERLLQGYADRKGNTHVPRQIWVDAGWEADQVYALCRRVNGKTPLAQWRVRPALGRGVVQHQRMLRYSGPTKKSAEVRHVGDGYHVNRIKAKNVWVVLVNADVWKDRVFDRLQYRTDQPGVIRLPAGLLVEHKELVHQLSQEKRTQKWDPHKRQYVVVWEQMQRSDRNHYWDCLYNCGAAGDLCGARVVGAADADTDAEREVPAEPTVRVHTLDGRPFVARR